MALERKKVSYNQTKLIFKEETRHRSVVVASENLEHRIVVFPNPSPDGSEQISFISKKATWALKVMPVGGPSVEVIMALAQCYYMARHADDIGDLEQIQYAVGGKLYQHTYDRDVHYDQPILIHLDTIKAKETRQHGH